MSLWRVTELIREFRYFWPAGDCGGVSLGTLFALVLVSWLSGVVFGLSVAAILFSTTCRKALLFLLHSAITVLGSSTAGVVTDRAVQLRSRLREYRHGE